MQHTFYSHQIAHFLDRLLFEDAAFLAERYVAESQSPHAFFLLAKSLFLSGQIRLAYNILKHELGASNLFKHFDSLYLFGLCCVKMTKCDEAIEVFQKCLDLVELKGDAGISNQQISSVYSSLAGVYRYSFSFILGD